MSLFPSAGGSNSQIEGDTAQSSWLTNNSFASAASFQLQQNKTEPTRLVSEENEKHQFEFPTKPTEVEHSDNESSTTDEKGSQQSTSSSSDEEPRRKKQNKQKTTKHPKMEDENLLQEGYCIDRKGDKNYLYFRRPYQTRIPKFWRVTLNCLGLPRHLKVELKEGKKRKKRKHEPPLERYFHIDEDSENENNKKEANSLQVERLNQITRTDPHDEENWIQLVELQDELSCKNKSLIAEKKVSILDKAISHNQTSVALKLKRLQVLDSVAQDTFRDWENFVFQHSDNKEAWFKYLNHIKTDRRFTVRRVLTAFGKSLERLTTHMHRSDDDVIKAVNYESMMMEIFADLIKFLLECGHDERCFYLLAIMVEMNINRCNTQQVDMDDVEKFCRSDDPLIGEEKAKGFDSWMQQHQQGGWVTDDGDVDDVIDDDDDDDEANPDQTLADNWLRIEKLRSKRDFLPWRVKAECEDEKRRVDFEQIKHLIFFIHDDGNRLKLVDLFLRFIGVDLKDRDDVNFQHSHPCHLIHACNNFHDRFTSITADQPCHNNCPHLLKLNPTRHQTFTRAFQQLVKVAADAHTSTLFPKLAGLWLDYHRGRVNASRSGEAKRKCAKKARIAARNLLQHQPTNIDLWMKFARIELCAGKRDDCRKIVFNSLKSRPSSCGLEICVQFSTFAWKCDGDAVRRVLTALGDDCKFKKHLKSLSEPISAAVVLRVGHFYMNKCEDLACLYEGHVCDATGESPSQLASWLVCTLMFFFLTSPSTLASVEKDLSPVLRRMVTLHSHEGNLQATSDLKMIRELQMELKDDLMTSSVDDSVNSKAKIEFRESVLQGLDDFPASSKFALQLCKMEVKSSLICNTRRYFSLHSTPTSNHHHHINDVITRHAIYTVTFELMRIKAAASGQVKNSPRIVNVLERAIKQNTGGGDSVVELWRVLLRFHPHGDVIVSRALTACPWSKSIALDAVARLGGGFLGEAVKHLTDHGLRVRTPVEEVELLMSLEGDDDDAEDASVEEEAVAGNTVSSVS